MRDWVKSLLAVFGQRLVLRATFGTPELRQMVAKYCSIVFCLSAEIQRGIAYVQPNFQVKIRGTKCSL